MADSNDPVTRLLRSARRDPITGGVTSPEVVDAFWDLRPLLRIWIKPRSTMRAVVAINPPNMTFILAILIGIHGWLGSTFIGSLIAGQINWIGVIASLPLGAAWGMFSIWLGGWFLRLVGGWFGGVADSRRVRDALAWSGVPNLAFLLLWIPMFGGIGLVSVMPQLMLLSVLLLMIYYTVTPILGLWSFVIFFPCLGEAHKFSTLKAIGTWLAAVGILIVPFILLTMIIVGIVQSLIS
jgi:hypothetical protein